MNAAVAPPPGSMIAGKYRVERTIGAGGMAVVVEAMHVVLGQRVAIKILHESASRSPALIERFRQEAQIAAQLPGEHVVRVTDIGQTERGEAFLVMELLIGRDLEADLAVRRYLPREEAVDLMLQACEGVAEAHAAGLVHRDLKPANLFLTRRRDGSPHVKVLDFGISKLLHREESLSLTQTTHHFGTPLYMSPEQIESVKHVDARSDQHSLAAILYTMLAGRPPYIAPTLPAISVLIATQGPPSLKGFRPDIPDGLEAAIMRGMAKKPEQRFADLGAFAEALAPYGGGGAQASVRRIVSTLMSGEPRAAFASMPSMPEHTPAPSRPHGLPMPSFSDPGSSGLIPNPMRAQPSQPSGSWTDISGMNQGSTYGPPGYAPMGQTSGALSAVLGSERSPAVGGRRMSVAIAIVSALAFALVLVVGLLLIGPSPNGSASGPEAPSSSSQAAAAAPSSGAAESAPAVSPPASAEPVPSTSVAAPAASSSTASSPAPVRTDGGAVKPAGKPLSSKKKDPSEVFGARR